VHHRLLLHVLLLEVGLLLRLLLGELLCLLLGELLCLLLPGLLLLEGAQRLLLLLLLLCLCLCLSLSTSLRLLLLLLLLLQGECLRLGLGLGLRIRLGLGLGLSLLQPKRFRLLSELLLVLFAFGVQRRPLCLLLLQELLTPLLLLVLRLLQTGRLLFEVTTVLGQFTLLLCVFGLKTFQLGGLRHNGERSEVDRERIERE
jgi:hypothetical protein